MSAAPLRIALVGAGGIGRLHAEMWGGIAGAELVGVYDTNATAAAAVAQEHGVGRVYETLELALTERGVNAIDVCTPNRFHAPVVIAALQAGKHCLCEKPLAATAAEIEQIIAARDRAGRLLMTAQHLRFEQRSLTLKRLIDGGAVGDVYHARAWWLRRRAAPATPGFLSKAQAVYGPGLDLGVHMLDLALHFMGSPQPVSVCGFAATKIGCQPECGNQWGTFRPEEYEVEDFATGFVRFANGAVLSLEVSWLLNMVENEVRRLWLHGTAGGVTWPELKLSHVVRGLLLDTEVASETGGDGYCNELLAFCEAVRTGGPSPVPAEQSLGVARVLEALYASAESGREVRL